MKKFIDFLQEMIKKSLEQKYIISRVRLKSLRIYEKNDFNK
jgi:hypothetical protein